MSLSFVDPIPSPIKFAQFVGPKAPVTSPGREHFNHRLNETASLSNQVYSKSITDPLCNSPDKLIESYKSIIDEHADRRIVLFLQKLFVCYGTRYHFEVGFTQHQGESAKAVKLQNGSSCTHNAAHSSTFPCLHAYPGDAWNAYKEGKAAKPEGFVFIQGSDLYRGMNATIDLPRDLNEADIALDGAHHNSPFSQKALELLNTVSMGKISPEKALDQFLDGALLHLRNTLKSDRTPGIKRSLEFYVEKFTEEKRGFALNPDSIYAHLNVAIDSFSPSEKLKKMVLKVRCETIRNNLLKQAELSSKINAVQKDVFALIKTNNKTPQYAEDAFRFLVIERMPTPEDKIRIQKFFATPPETYALRETRARITYLAKAKTKLLVHAQKIDTLCRELSTFMYHMRVEEIQHRGDILRAIRVGKSFSQVELSREIKARFPNEPSSQTTISRTERGERPIPDALAHKLSTCLNVPQGLLVAQFFNT